MTDVKYRNRDSLTKKTQIMQVIQYKILKDIMKNNNNNYIWKIMGNNLMV